MSAVSGTNLNESYVSVHPTQPSEIQQYFRDSTIFLTGATGFIGKLLLEKLLRSCPGVKRVYVLIRPKKGKDVKTRLEELLDCAVFDIMKRDQPHALDKIVAILGDCSLPNLGLSEDLKKTLCSEVNCVLHCAATVRFDEPLPIAVNINVRGTRDLLEIARKMKNLESFVYMSTAYCFCPRKDIEERFYEPPISAEKLLVISGTLTENTLKKITPILLGEWPNTYTYTKAVAEGLLKEAARDLPIVVIRPSIVTATASEPLEGWINNMYGSTGVVIGASTGLIRTLHCEPSYLADMVPADLVVNISLAAAWSIGRETQKGMYKMKHELDDAVEKRPRVFNCVSSVDNPITWRRYMRILEIHGKSLPTVLMIWSYCFTLNPNKFVHLLYTLILHTLPAYTIDTVLFCLGRKPRIVDMYRKVTKFTDVIAYFSTRQWNFSNDNVRRLWYELNDQDKDRFNFNASSFVWDRYLFSLIKGGRVYLLKDPMDTLEDARRKSRYFRIAHIVTITLVVLIVFKGLWLLANATIRH